MRELIPTTKFKKDLKKFRHQKDVILSLHNILNLFTKKQALPSKYTDHPLTGNWKGSRKCHVNPDVLLIYRVDEELDKLFLERFGSHSELFN